MAWDLHSLLSKGVSSSSRIKDKCISCRNSACHLLSRWFLAQLIYSTLKMEAICFSETSVDTAPGWCPRDEEVHVGNKGLRVVVP
jgi:hypothetical protein